MPFSIRALRAFRSPPRYWASRFPAALLWPLSALFGMLVALRRWGYRHIGGLVQRLPVPVVVVGNISVGGSGKTPTVCALADALRQQGHHPGIVSRGYGGKRAGVVQVPRFLSKERSGGRHPAVAPSGQIPAAHDEKTLRAENALEVMPDATYYGDEPLLLAQRSGCPVFVGRDRVAAARALLAACPETTVILSDDGLQHYRLGRDLEVVLLDAARGIQNGWLLPAGPLREPLARLQEADALVVHAAPLAAGPPWAFPAALQAFAPTALSHDASPADHAARPPARFMMSLEAAPAWSLADPAQTRPLPALAAQSRQQICAALAGIAHPARFFEMLEQLGIAHIPHPFPDHHPYTRADIEPLVAQFPHPMLLVTEKDAVKLAALLLTPAQRAYIWVLPVEARFSPDLADWVSRALPPATELPIALRETSKPTPCIAAARAGDRKK